MGEVRRTGAARELSREGRRVVSRSVLLVDDEDDIREVAQVSLETVADWQVHTAASGQEALEAAASHQPDVILLDVMMPDMDGTAVFGELQQQDATSEIPVILLTAKTQSVDRERFVGLGVAGVLSKPFDPMGLANDVADILGWPR
jgi:CheY-like chemotaxis protein